MPHSQTWCWVLREGDCFHSIFSILFVMVTYYLALSLLLLLLIIITTIILSMSQVSGTHKTWTTHPSHACQARTDAQWHFFNKPFYSLWLTIGLISSEDCGKVFWEIPSWACQRTWCNVPGNLEFSNFFYDEEINFKCRVINCRYWKQQEIFMKITNDKNRPAHGCHLGSGFMCTYVALIMHTDHSEKFCQVPVKCPGYSVPPMWSCCSRIRGMSEPTIPHDLKKEYSLTELTRHPEGEGA